MLIRGARPRRGHAVYKFAGNRILTFVDTPAKRAASPKRHTVKLAALGPVRLNPAASGPVAARCDPAKFRIVLDVGHTAESEGATSARNVSEFAFNLRLAKQIEAKLKAEGFAETRLLLTEGKARRSLVRRVDAANNLRADLFLSIHRDSVPNKFLENWEFEGKKSRFSDRFSGYSVFVSRSNPDFKTSFAFAELIGKEMKARASIMPGNIRKRSWAGTSVSC